MDEGTLANVVVKVGGSVLEFEELATRLQWLGTRLRSSFSIYVAGGGPAADLVRAWDEVHALGEEASHRLALAAMGLNSRLLAALIPGSFLARNRKELVSGWRSGGTRAVIDPLPFTEAEEARSLEGPLLPHRWAATSDSVAAWIAIRMGARELVLLKAVAPPEGASLEDLAASGYVDTVLPELARGRLEVFAAAFRSGSQELVEVRSRDVNR